MSGKDSFPVVPLGGLKYRICTVDFDPSIGSQQHAVIQGFAESHDEALEVAGGFLKSHKAVVIEKVSISVSSEDMRVLEALR